ncbi:TadE/TadG family type IV pilus assembly protein [Enterovirga rhinocerotis]|uniref:TadE-like protein n=1 Tax=Enterovirga rhinocerotis TaxID=1339210 RepID=A0A4R7CCZ7_9HYPH|nr:TadE/TadG family type IV pilus assembly protein [Enterovirga rhinocerotis]TDR94697.1 TadE-like protein [Enterovirga rhinocerotis]
MPSIFARSLLGPLQRAAGHARRLGTASAGVAAIEFSLILPVMLVLYFGLTEVTPAINIKRKLSLVARTLADLSSRSATLSTDELKNIFSASSAIMRPYDRAGQTQMLVTLVDVTQATKGGPYTGKVAWSCGWNLATAPTGEDLRKPAEQSDHVVPAGYANDTTKSFIVVTTLYPYSPVIGHAISGTIHLKETTPWPIRDADRVAKPVCPPQS